MSDEEVIYTEETPKNISAEDNVTTDINKEEKIDGKKKFHLSVYDLVSVVMSSFIIIAIIFTFVFRLVGVDGLSMTNTLQDGDWLLTVQKSEYEYGDIVVITQDTYFHEPLIKRVIATGGQTVDIDYETATIYVDGTALEEPYVKEDFLLEKGDYREFPYTVPEGHLFCMGDNRNGSTDSRSYHVGDIDERYILGKAVVRILPVGDFDIYDYE
ncbi:MAG: signal peptidase I [Clostridia bacterium]|nr:signal peptidase I [Clostridia bacterium]